jgi:hypothetical protein
MLALAERALFQLEMERLRIPYAPAAKLGGRNILRNILEE